MFTDDLRTVVNLHIEKGTSLREVARKTGIAPSNLHRFLRGDRRASGAQVDALCEYMGITLPQPRTRKGKT